MEGGYFGVSEFRHCDRMAAACCCTSIACSNRPTSWSAVPRLFRFVGSPLFHDMDIVLGDE